MSPLLPFRHESSCRKPFPFIAPHAMYTYLARGAIYHLMRALDLAANEVVLVPDYHHGNEVRAIRAAGATTRFYPINRDLEPDLEALERLMTPDVRVLFVIHYIGWPQPMHAIAELAKKHNVILIEDCALSMFTELEGRPIGTFGDYSIFCLYKTLPVPNGGMLVSTKPLPPALAELQLEPCDVASVAGRTLQLALETLQTHAEWAANGLLAVKRAAGSAMTKANVQRVPVGDDGFDLAGANLGIAPFTMRLMERIDFEEIPETRRLRHDQLARRLRGRTTFIDRDAIAGTCPLFFPLLVDDKHAAVKLLQKRGIGSVEFWNRGLVEPAPGTAAEFFRRHIIELPIHQDVTPDQVDYIADVVLAERLGLHEDPGLLRRAG